MVSISVFEIVLLAWMIYTVADSRAFLRFYAYASRKNHSFITPRSYWFTHRYIDINSHFKPRACVPLPVKNHLFRSLRSGVNSSKKSDIIYVFMLAEQVKIVFFFRNKTFQKGTSLS